MSFSFVKSDNSSFSNFSRVYEVYNYEEERPLRTAFVIGYLTGLEKYYITMLGDDPLWNKYSLEAKNISTNEFIDILQEFFNFLEFMDPADFIIDGPTLTNCTPLKKENFLAYVSDIEPYFDEEDDDYDGTIVSYDDIHADYLMNENVFIPFVMCSDEIDEYEPYDYDRFFEYWDDGTGVEFYCEIDFEKLYKYYIEE